MHTLMAIALAWLGLTNMPAPAVQPAASAPMPLLAVACDDSLDFFLLLGNPAVNTQVLSVTDCGAFSMVAALHSSSNATVGAYSWISLYTFPSTIFAHTIVKLHIHAEEME